MKKLTISILLFSFIMFSSYFLFAASTIENGVSHIGNAVKDTAEGTKNVVMNTGNTIGNGIKNSTNTLSDSGEKAMNTLENTDNSIMGSINNNNNNYNAVRTAADVSVLGMTTNTWTWLIIAIVGAVIIGLVWYYGAQYEHKNFDNE